jgi:hypothetical protein
VPRNASRSSVNAPPPELACRPSPARRGINACPSPRQDVQYSYPQCPHALLRRQRGLKSRAHWRQAGGVSYELEVELALKVVGVCGTRHSCTDTPELGLVGNSELGAATVPRNPPIWTSVATITVAEHHFLGAVGILNTHRKTRQAAADQILTLATQRLGRDVRIGSPEWVGCPFMASGGCGV